MLIRVVNEADQNFRLNPNTGALTATDGTLAFAAGDPNLGGNPNIVAAGYTNSFAGASSTTLYVLDSNLDILATQNPPNNGTLNTVGALGVNFGALAGFDIDRVGNVAYASLNNSLYTVNLTTGAATLVGSIGTGLTLASIAVAPVPEPGTVALLGAGLAMLAGFSLKRRPQK